MAAPRLTNLKVYDADTYAFGGSNEVKADGDNDLFDHVESWRIDESIERATVLTLTVFKGHTWHVEDILQHRHRIVAEWDNGDKELFRVTSIKLGTGEQSALTVEAWGIETDLSEHLFSYLDDPLESVSHALDFSNMAVSTILNRLFDPDYGLPSFFKLGTVETSIASLIVTIYSNDSHFNELLAALADEINNKHGLGFEYEKVFDQAAPSFTFNFFEEAGWSAAERTAGNADPDSRIIKAPTGHAADQDDGEGEPAPSSRLLVQLDKTQTDFFTRLKPSGGADESQAIGVGGVFWAVESAVFLSPNTTVEFTDDPVHLSNIFDDGSYSLRSPGGTSYAIVSTTKPGQVVVTGDASAEISLKFISNDGFSKNAIGSDVAYVHDPVAEALSGVVEKKIRFPDIPPFANLFVEGGGSGNMSTWSGGLPVGMNKIDGAEVVTEATEAIFVRHGTKSAKVVCGKDEGLQTDLINLLPDQLSPYFSAYIALRVETGRVKLFIVDALGKVFPPETTEQYEGATDQSIAIGLPPAEPALGNARVKVVAVEDSTIFYLDALVLTQSVGWWEFAERMGPRALWHAAFEELIANGGTRPLAIQTRFLDVSHFGIGSRAEAGAWCRILDLYDIPTTTFGLDVTGRFETVRRGSDDQGPYTRARVGSVRSSLADRFNGRAPRPKPDVMPRQQRIVVGDRLHFGIFQWQVGDQGFLRIVPFDPDKHITLVRVHKEIGKPLPAPGSESWTTLPLDPGGYYETSVTIDPKHSSWIRYEIQLDGGATTSITDDVSYDFNEDARILEMSLDYTPATGDVTLTWRDDEDTGGSVYAFSKTSQAAIDDAAFLAAIVASQFVNGNGRKSTTLDANMVPGETLYVGLRPFTEALTTGSSATVNNGPDAFDSHYVPTRADLPTFDVKVDKSGTTVTLTIEILTDPAALFTQVDFRTSLGRDLIPADAYTIGSQAGADWSRGLDIATALKHNSFIQAKIVTIAGVDDIVLEPLPIDANPIPEGNVNFRLVYVEASRDYDLYVSWVGDDDTGSVRAEETVSVSVVNSNNVIDDVLLATGLAPGASIRPLVTGYTGTGQTGSSNVWHDSTVPVDTEAGAAFSWDNGKNRLDDGGITLRAESKTQANTIKWKSAGGTTYLETWSTILNAHIQNLNGTLTVEGKTSAVLRTSDTDGLVQVGNPGPTIGSFTTIFGDIVILENGTVQHLIASGQIVDMNGITDSLILPTGTTAQRGSGVNGKLRYNTTLGVFEGYKAGAWTTFETGSGATAITDDTIPKGTGSGIEDSNWSITDAGILSSVAAGAKLGIGTIPAFTLDVRSSGTASFAVSSTAATGIALIELGQSSSGNHFAIIDLRGDATYTDYGLRIIRHDQGANSKSELVHRGTGTFRFKATDAGSIEFLTNALVRMTIDANGNVDVSGSILVTGPYKNVSVQEWKNQPSGPLAPASGFTSLYTLASDDRFYFREGASGQIHKIITDQDVIGDVLAAAVIVDHAVVRGDGGVKGVQGSAITLDDDGDMHFPSEDRILMGVGGNLILGYISSKAQIDAAGSNTLWLRAGGVDKVEILTGSTGAVRIKTVLDIVEDTTPGVPAAGHARLFYTTNDNFGFIQSSGTTHYAVKSIGDGTLVDHRLIRGDGGTTGVQDSGVTLDDSNNLSGVIEIKCQKVNRAVGTLIVKGQGLSLQELTNTPRLTIPEDGDVEIVVGGSLPSYLVFTGLPTSDPGGVGRAWLNSGVLTVTS